MKTYITPMAEVHSAQVGQMLAESLPIGTTTVDGKDALSKENDSWDIWNEE